MKQKLVIISAIFFLLLTACREKNDDSINMPEQIAELVTETEEIIMEETTEETTEQAYQPATREYFENVNKDYTRYDIVDEIGKHNKIYGSGEIYYVWRLDDETEAYVNFFEVDEKIERIHIVHSDGSGELIYMRYHQTQDKP